MPQFPQLENGEEAAEDLQEVPWGPARGAKGCCCGLIL